MSAPIAVLLLMITATMTSCHIDRQSPGSANYAAWSRIDGDGVWTYLAEASVQNTSLADLLPDDIDQFCPAYAVLRQPSRIRFWVALLSAMVKHESNFDPGTTYTESSIRDSSGQPVVSRGLLQLSYESARQARYGCEVESEQDLHDPAVNLACGARILATWVDNDGLVASSDQGRLGGARYWSTLWSSRDSLPQIRRFTQNLAFCSP